MTDGRETLCQQQVTSGYSIDGAFAVPPGVGPIDTAPLICAGLTAYKAVKVAKVQPGENVAVFGIGGLGHLALQHAHIVGATVIGVDIQDEKLALATKLDTVIRGISIIGSIVGTRTDLAEVFEQHWQGRTTVISQGRKLDDANGAIAEVLLAIVPHAAEELHATHTIIGLLEPAANSEPATQYGNLGRGDQAGTEWSDRDSRVVRIDRRN